MEKPAKYHRAITLTEILVIVIILTTLTIIGIPIYTNSRERIRDVEAKAAIKALATAEHVYFSRFKNYFCKVSGIPGQGVETDLDNININLGTAVSPSSEWKFCIERIYRATDDQCFVYARRLQGPNAKMIWQSYLNNGAFPTEPSRVYSWPKDCDK